MFYYPQVNESCPVVLYESRQMLPSLEELEKQMAHFYESYKKVNEIISVLDPEVQPADVFKQQHQVFLVCILNLPENIAFWAFFLDFE